MPHQRLRYLSKSIVKALKFSPAVGILGQRQTGKTTLLSEYAAEYTSLDNRQNLDHALSEPETFVNNRKAPFAIDECQLSPPLFPALKEHIRQHPGMGRFILSGSVRFTSRRAIRESLTGRIYNLELLPLSWSESNHLPLSDLPLKLLRGTERGVLDCLKARYGTKPHWNLNEFLKTGGLPGICFIRDESARARKLDSHIETLLERDLRLILDSKLSLQSLRTVLTALALRQGRPLDISDVARSTRVSRPTIRQLIRTFESLFLIRTLPAEGGTAKPMIFFEDQGMATHLARSLDEPTLNAVRAIIANVYPQMHYLDGLNPGFFHFLTRGGAQVPFAAKTPHGVIGYIADPNPLPSLSAVASAKSFLKKFKNARVVIAHMGSEIRCIQPQLYSAPLKAIL